MIAIFCFFLCLTTDEDDDRGHINHYDERNNIERNTKKKIK